MKRKKILLTIIAIGFIFLYFFYKYLYFESENNLKIAVVGPMSGSSKIIGQAFVKGINLYFEGENKFKDKNEVKIIIDIFDDQNNANCAKKIAEKICSLNKYVAVIGHHYSSCSISAGKIYKQYGIPAISPASTNIKVTCDNDWYFRTIFNDYLQSKFLAIYIKEVLQEKRVSIIHEDLEYGSYLARVFEKNAHELNIKVPYILKFQHDDSNLDNILEGIVRKISKKNDTGMIFLATHASEGIKIIKMMKDLNISKPVIGPDAFASEAFQKGFEIYPKEKERTGYYTNGIYVITPIIFDTTNEEGQTFKNNYVTKYGKEPGWHAAFAFDTAKLIHKAIISTYNPEQNKSLIEQRNDIKNWLKSISNIEKSVPGITGFNFFDSNGDSPKPVSIGVYKNGNIISALTQLKAISDISEVSNLKESLASKDIIKVDNQYLSKTNVVYTGIDIKKIDNLDIYNQSFYMDCHLWFRYRGKIKPEDIVFVNAEEDVLLTNLEKKKYSDGNIYSLYNLKGKFKMNFMPYPLPFGKHLIGLCFHHRKIDRNNLIYVVDVLGMGMTKNVSFINRLKRAKILKPSFGWSFDEAHFFQSISEKSALGTPEYLALKEGMIKFSQFNMSLRIKKNKINLIQISELFPFGINKKILILCMFMIILLSIIARKTIFQNFSNLIWLIQIIILFLALLSTEIVLLNWMLEKTNIENANLAKRLFDILWWIIPAFCLNMAVKRFIWIPLEEKTHRIIPTVAKRFVGFIIIILAFFGIIAFVFDEKITGLLATSGVVAMIIGLAVQMNISNIFSGIALNIERPFRTGDWI